MRLFVMIVLTVYMQYKCYVRGKYHKADSCKYKKALTS